jgi:hypothetical protein
MAYRTPTEMSMTRFAKLRWLGWMVLAISSLVLPAAALAQQGAFQVGILSPETAQERIPALISVLRGGEIIGQNEVVLGASSLTGWITAKLGLGVYDVRVEAEGLRTEVKRGVRVLDGQSTNVTFVVRRGTGVHIVEYATGGLSREEVAARPALRRGDFHRPAPAAGGLDQATITAASPGRPLLHHYQH